MLIIDALGRVQNPRIKLAICPAIEHGEMKVIHGIIVHQTDSATAQSTLNGYKTPKPNGAHFLIDKGWHDISDCLCLQKDPSCWLH